MEHELTDGGLACPGTPPDWSAWLEAYGPRLMLYARQQTRSMSDAEDVMQEVFVKRLCCAPEFETAEHERRWLFRVALNQCRDEWKRSRRTEVPLEEAALMAVPPEEREVLEQVAALPEKLRTVLHLHYYEGYSLEEMAALLGVTVSAVKMRMKRGRDALRIRLEGTE